MGLGLLHDATRPACHRIGFTIYSLPRTPQARIEYLQMIAEEIVRKVAKWKPETSSSPFVEP